MRSTEIRNLAEERRRKTEDLLAATEGDLARIANPVRRRKSLSQVECLFRALLQELKPCCRNRCRVASDTSGSTFDRLSDLTPLQERAFDLLGCTPCT